jgi:hypothetical protein
MLRQFDLQSTLRGKIFGGLTLALSSNASCWPLQRLWLQARRASRERARATDAAAQSAVKTSLQLLHFQLDFFLTFFVFEPKNREKAFCG